MKLHLVVGLLLASLSLAGCTGGDSDSNTDDFRNELNNGETQTSGTQDDGSPPPGDDSGTNTSTDEPAGEGTIDVDFTASTLSGNLPLTVTFDLDAVFKDADGIAQDDVAAEWAIFSADEALGFETEGTSLPAQANFTFDQEGSWVMAAGVKADGYQNRIVNVTIEVLAAGDELTSQPEKWFLYYPAPDGCGDPYMSKDAGGEDSGCRAVAHPANIIVGAITDVTGPIPEVGDAWTTFEADQASNGHPTGSVVEGTYGWFRLGAGTGTIDWELYADGDLVGSGSNEVSAGPGLGEYQYDFSGSTSAAIPAGAHLSFQFRIMSGDYYEASGYDRYLTISPA